jgi:hypothetical protein
MLAKHVLWLRHVHRNSTDQVGNAGHGLNISVYLFHTHLCVHCIYSTDMLIMSESPPSVTRTLKQLEGC